MDEHQHNIAMGAGGITKVYFPKENRLERVPNVYNYEEYINRIDEIIVFDKLGENEIKQIIEIMLNTVQKRLKEPQQIVKV